MKARAPTVPHERAQTAREALEAELRTGIFATARELGAAAKLREREVTDHLEHLEKSLRARGERIEIDPAECLACGYVFEDRTRFTTPSVCPTCKSARVQPPSFRVPTPASE